MARGFNWDKKRYEGLRREPARPMRRQKLKGAWTHVKRQPVRHVSIEEYLATSATALGDDQHA